MMILFQWSTSWFGTKKTSLRDNIQRIFALTKKNSRRTASNLNTQKILQSAKIFHVEAITEICFKSLDGGRIIATNDEIININEYSKLSPVLKQSKERMI